MSLAKDIIKKQQFWRQEGQQEGRQEGLLAGQRRQLLRLLRLKFGTLPQIVEDQLESASDEQLNLWADWVLFASSLGEVFAQ